MTYKRLSALLLALLPLGTTACGGSHSHKLLWIGRAQNVAATQVPYGPAFSIAGQRYRFGRRTYLAISTRFAEPWRVAGGGLESRWGGSQLLVGDITVTVGCQLRPFLIIDGLLKAPGNATIVRAGGEIIHLRQVTLPRSLRTNAVLVYGATSASPTALELRTPDGKVLRLRRLSWSRSFPENCEGPERAWVAAHFKPVFVDDALARIAECLRGKGFEAGAPDEPSLDFLHTAKWRQFRDLQRLCRMEVAAAMATS